MSVFRPGDDVREVPLTFPDYSGNSRALGLADMAKALRTGRDFRCSYVQTLHVLEIMEGFTKSGHEHHEVAIESYYERRKPIDKSMATGVLD